MRQNYGIPTIAESGLQNNGHVLKAFALGASAVVLDDLLGGTDEAMGRPFLNPSDGSWLKIMHGAEPGRAVRQVPGTMVAKNPQNKLGLTQSDIVVAQALSSVGCKGSVRSLVDYLCKGLQHGLRDLGCKSVEEAHAALVSGELRMECRGTYAIQSSAQTKQDLELSERQEVYPILPPSVMVGGGV
jgi:IMP dehydrogenase